MRRPSAIAVEFLEVLNHWFDESFMASLLVLPDGWRIQDDSYPARDYSSIVEVVQNLLRTAYDSHFFVEEMCFIDRARLKLLCYTALSLSLSFGVYSCPNILESSRRKDPISFDGCLGGIVCS